MNRLKSGVLVLMLAAASALAQPSYDGYDTTVDGDAVGSVDVFYDQLTPYGVWVDDAYGGRVFIPDANNYVPYTQGHWEYTTIGFVWISAEPFAWATAHYGRWYFSRSYRRWAWRPDTVWGPSWVEWRQSGDYFGWAPLAPTVSIEIGYAPPIESWHYCATAHILDTNVSRYYEPPTRVVEIHRDARPAMNYASIAGTRVVVGPSPTILREHHVDVRPVKIEARAAGRWTPSESHDAVKRAEEHRATNEELNHKRLDSHPALREAEKQVAKPQVKAEQPRQIEQPKREPAKPQVEPRKVEPRQIEQPKREPAKPQVEPRKTEQPKQIEQPKREPAKPQVEPRKTEQQPREQPKPQPPQVQQPRQPAPREQPKPQPQPAPREQPKPQPPQVQQPRQPAPHEQPKPQPQPAPREQPKPQPPQVQQPRQPAPHEQPKPQPQPAPHEQPKAQDHKRP